MRGCIGCTNAIRYMPLILLGIPSKYEDVINRLVHHNEAIFNTVTLESSIEIGTTCACILFSLSGLPAGRLMFWCTAACHEIDNIKLQSHRSQYAKSTIDSTLSLSLAFSLHSSQSTRVP